MEGASPENHCWC